MSRNKSGIYLNKEILANKSPEEIYKLVLDGYLKRFPNNYWRDSDSKNNAALITRYLFEKILKWDVNTIKENVKLSYFYDHKLNGMINICFNDSVYEAIENAYPSSIFPWELSKAPMGFWQDDTNVVRALDWLFHHKYNLSVDEIRDVFNNEFLIDNNLREILVRFNFNSHEILEFYMPGVYKPWEITKVTDGYWNNEDNINDALNWLFEEKLKMDLPQLQKHFNTQLIKDYKLLGLLRYKFKSSPYLMINHYYPGKLKPWHLSNVPKNYWSNHENIKNAITWLVLDILQIKYESFISYDKRKIKDLMCSNGLGGLFYNTFKSRKSNIVNFVSLEFLR